MGIEDDYILDETPDIEPEEPEEEPEPSAADELREELKEEAKERLKEKAREKYDQYKEGKKAAKEGRPGEPPRAKQVPEAKPGAGKGVEKGVGEAGGQAGKAAGKAGAKAGGEAAKGVAETGVKAGEGLARAGTTGANVARAGAGVAETGEVVAVAWPVILGIIVAILILAIISFIIGFVVGLSTGGTGSSTSQSSISTSGTAIVNGVVLYKQGDARWGSIPYGSHNTLAGAACGPSSVAMVLATYGVDITPVEAAQYSVDNGYRLSYGTSTALFDSIAKHYGFSGAKAIGSSTNSIIEQLNNGYPVIVNMKNGIFTDGGHFIVVTGYDNGTFYINDPGGRNVTEATTQQMIDGKIANSWIIEK